MINSVNYAHFGGEYHVSECISTYFEDLIEMGREICSQYRIL